MEKKEGGTVYESAHLFEQRRRQAERQRRQEVSEADVVDFNLASKRLTKMVREELPDNTDELPLQVRAELRMFDLQGHLPAGRYNTDLYRRHYQSLAHHSKDDLAEMILGLGESAWTTHPAYCNALFNLYLQKE